MSSLIHNHKTHPLPSNVAPRRYIYLCSPAHSGSTLLACLAAAHPNISTVGEYCVPLSETSLCSCNQPYAECSFWQEWIKLVNDSGIDFSPSGVKRWVGRREGESIWDAAFYRSYCWPSIDRVRDLVFSHSEKQRSAESKIVRLVRIAQLLCELEGTNAFVDTSKNSACVRFLLKQHLMPLRVISLVRDGRGTVCSLMKWYGKSLRTAVVEWKHSIQQAQYALRNVPPECVLQLRYEELVTDFEPSLDRFYRFCGVDPNAPLDFSPDRRHIIGNAMRHTFDGNTHLDEAWRERLTKADLNYFDANAGTLNRSLGYAN
jgi:hypothetical protein